MSILTPYHHLFSVKLEASLSEARKELKKNGLKEIYTVEDKSQGMRFLGGYSTSSSPPEKLILVDYVETCSTIDWEAQAREFSPYYLEGLLQIPLVHFGKSEATLKLLPGEGFGDLSHPTTEMMLSTLSTKVEDKLVLDIGCGNGILSFASSYFGAKKTWGIDIEEKAIALANENLNLNQLENLVQFFHNSEYCTKPVPDVILLNMISSEQKIAWNSFPHLHEIPLEIITSGILKSQKANYLEICSLHNWEVVEEIEKNGWLTFVLSQT